MSNLKSLPPLHVPQPGEVIHEGNHWWMKHNRAPYRGLRIHLLLIPKTFITRLADVTPEMSAEVLGHFAWAEKEFGIEGGAIVMRFGDPLYHGATQKVLHFHIEAPDLTVPVEMLFYKKRE